MKKNKKLDLGIALALAVVGIVLIALVDSGVIADNYVKRILNMCAIYTIVALSMNLVNGFTGLFSLGQAGFMAIGAYSVAIFTVPVNLRTAIFYIEPMDPLIANIQLPFVVALLIGGLVAAFAAILIGAPVLRLRGDYLGIATLGFSEIIRIVFSNLQTITNGALGINKIPPITSMWWPFGTAIVVIVFVALLVNSSYGRAFKAIREDEIAAQAMGINLFKHKVMSFAIGAFLAAIGGGLYAAILGTVDPQNFYFTFTYNFLLIIVLGGMGSISGTIIASFVVTAGLEWLRVLDESTGIPALDVIFRPGLRMVVFSLALVLIVLFYSRGLMGTNELTPAFVRKKIARFKERRAAKQGGGAQ